MDSEDPQGAGEDNRANRPATSPRAIVPNPSLTRSILGGAIRVHRELGPGLLESAYRACLAHELALRGLRVERERAIPLRYRGLELNCGYRIDLLVEGCVVLELKAVKELERVHVAQLVTYLRLAGLPLGLLMNFHVPLMRLGIRRIANYSHRV